MRGSNLECTNIEKLPCLSEETSIFAVFTLQKLNCTTKLDQKEEETPFNYIKAEKYLSMFWSFSDANVHI